MRSLMWVGLALILASACAGGASRAAEPSGDLRRFEFTEQKMGAGFRVVLYTPDEATAKAAAAAAFKRVDELNGVLSDYDPTSEVSRLSQRTLQGPMGEPVEMSAELFHVLLKAVEASERTGGAFDVTVGPFVRLWRRSRDMWELPTPRRIETTRESVGYRHIKLDPERRTVQLLAPRMRLDLSGIAVGYIVDEAMAAVRKAGVSRALIDAGGDVLAGDPPPGEAGWRVAIRSTVKPDETAGYALLRNAAISTSGDTYRFVEIDGKRYSHIVDPQTGLGLSRRVGATVIAPDCMTADWMATACCVLGPERGGELVKDIAGVGARITTLEDRGIQVCDTPEFQKYMTHPAAAEPGSALP